MIYLRSVSGISDHIWYIYSLSLVYIPYISDASLVPAALALLLLKLTDKAKAFVPSADWLSDQRAGLDPSEGLKDALDIVVGEVGVNRRHVDSVKGPCLLCQLVDDWLSLADVTGPPNLQDKQQAKRRVMMNNLLVSR